MVDTLSKRCIDYTKEEWAELRKKLQNSLSNTIEDFQKEYKIQPTLKLEGTFDSIIKVDFFNRKVMVFDKPLSESKNELETYTEYIKGNQ